MNDKTLSRRGSLRLVAIVAATAALGIASPGAAAEATQFHTDAALVTLRLALRELNNAAEDKGGHRAKAIGLLNAVIAEVELGIQFAGPR